MSPLRHKLAATALLASTAIAGAHAATLDDPNIWLEDVSSPRAMDWVNAHNATTTQRLQADPRYKTLYDQALAVAANKDRIPAPTFTHGQIFNFWQDADHLRGIWRKTTLASYRTAHPQWSTVLDIDALGKAENKSWVLRGRNCLEPDENRCLISLSNGGEDAVEVREFDLARQLFVPDGFHLPRGKHKIAWEDANHLLIATDWTPGDVTPSGYPFIVKRLTRGQSLDQAIEIYRGDKNDGGYGVAPAVLQDGQGRQLAIIVRPLDTFRHQTFVITPKGVQRLAIPDKVDVVDLVDNRVILSLDEPWKGHPAGALVAVNRDALLADPQNLDPKPVWAPGPQDAMDSHTSTRNNVLLATLHNVQGRATVLKPHPHDQWRTQTLPLPDNLAISWGSTDVKSDRAFLGASGFLTPSTLYLSDTAKGTLEPVKTLPAQFDATQDIVEQFEATSTDGTKIPYFIVHRKDIRYDGQTPTLMTAYGGFEVSETPYYSATIGKLWLERGGAFVLANIRGGGEFGPKWHDAGLATRRQVIYDDFAAVAKDLDARKITSPRRLGIEGGSNGGLLMGVEFTEHPELWNAVVIQVPLLDMIRISKIAAGASWQGEYGDVNADPAVMAFWQKTSPYQNLKADVKYPEPFIFTTTKDDRVGPQHARKFAARMEEMKLPFYYYENTEGGHGSGADLKQSARTQALTMTYLQEKLMN
ncbi:prolyl oligopeptidase [Neoasaia chiangmaiensis NBRC 101099]|uniref:prolyl oligopeptidase family serine peptidase n=1 Tax=Neoasaia chiangmaiensis TaxID=320497 RepID=UPI00098B266F|nr:prolyl oligopeptidase family serine peptidase [Neoasaia chiangmaiensis]GBR38875.1 prolyl oligopeptidase [Neoasaia chiangmaiensis NBRC 101099]GEN15670.1 peptidase [Neoasaia chiangmaiensis]